MKVLALERRNFLELVTDIQELIDKVNGEGYKLTNISHSSYLEPGGDTVYSVVIIFDKI